MLNFFQLRIKYLLQILSSICVTSYDHFHQVCGEDSPTRKRDALDNTTNCIIMNELSECSMKD